MYYILSPSYTIRNEKNCSYIIKINHITSEKESNFNTLTIPPFMGYILANIGKYPIPHAYEIISRKLSVSPLSIKTFVEQLVGRTGTSRFLISNNLEINLPINLLVYSEKPQKIEYLESSNFNPREEFVIKRPSMPTTANLMVTTKCNTDCIYCYANRSLKPTMSTSEIIRIINELHDGGVINLSLTGGDIFTHKEWHLILKETHRCGYKPMLSTKTPLNKDSLLLLKKLGYHEFQFSLDSYEPQVLSTLLKVKHNYIDCVVDMLKNCIDLDLKIQIRSVLTKLNGNYEQFSNFYNFLTQFSCIKEWDITPAFFSEYKKDTYKDYKIENENLKKIYRFTQQTDLKLRIGINKFNSDGYVLKRCSSVEDFVCKNQICLANTTTISILANGLCSICEMLYEHDEYILGNVLTDSIFNIWNSNKALNLYSPKQEEIVNDSPCKECSVFENCKTKFGKRICYLDIAKMKGEKDDPDPRCPTAKKCNIIL